MTELPPNLQPGFMQESAKTAPMPWIWAGAAALIAVALFLLVFLLARRKKKKAGKQRALPRIANIHGIGKRDSQQDTFAVSSCEDGALCARKGVLAVLADGMGGLSHGAEISNMAVKTMMEGFSAARQSAQTPQEELRNLLRLADRQVREYMEARAIERGGSTLIAVLIRDGMMDYVSVGDSRLCLVRDGAIRTLNRVHNYGAELDELARQGAIEQEYAASHPSRNALTSYVGIRELKKVDGSEESIKLQKGDRLILMSDGVFNTLRDEEILRCMKPDVYASAVCLEREILDRNDNEQDNYTAILIDQP